MVIFYCFHLYLKRYNVYIIVGECMKRRNSLMAKVNFLRGEKVNLPATGDTNTFNK